MNELQKPDHLDRSTCDDALRRRSGARRLSTANTVLLHRAPRETAFQSQEPGAGRSPGTDYSADSRTPSVLIVGSFSDCDMYAEYFRSIGFLVEHVRKPEEAMRYPQSSERAVIICDMVFENSAYDGPAFMQAVRRRPECSTTNMIVVSGYTRAADRQRARAAGADLFLVKPCAPEDLWRHVDRALWAYEHHSRAEWNWPEEAMSERCARERRRPSAV